MGLLLLRTAVGVTAVIQGSAYFSSVPGTAETWLTGSLLAASGATMLIGFMTPVAGVVMAMVTSGIALTWLPAPNQNLLGQPLAAVLVITIATSVACLGPGALSVDCRLFGRREIIIPHRPA